MDNLILNEFYNNILPNVKNNNLSIDGFKFNIEFQTIIGNNNNFTNYEVEETLIISDVDSFNLLLVEYTNKMFNIITNSQLKEIDYVYYGGKKKYIIDFILSNLWSNVTDSDLTNPLDYLRKRINFLDDPLYDYDSKVVYLTNIDFLDYSDIEYTIELNNPIMETPYSFNSRIVRKKVDNEIFELPKIFYGISNETCYIYAVQGPNKKIDSNYEKKINRILYKVNKDVTADYDMNNILNVTPRKENNIAKIQVIDYMPLRYKAKENTIKYKISKLKNQMGPKEIEVLKEESINKHNKIQSNMTDKFLRNFKRLEEQLGILNITSYPKDVDSNMHINLGDNFINTDNILNSLYCYENVKQNKI